MSHVHRTAYRGLTAIAAAVLVLGGFGSAHAALTTPECLAKKLKEWGKLRNCQAKENANALQGKKADPAKCQTTFDEKLAKLTAQATEAAIACRYVVNGDGTATDYDTGLQWEQKTDDGSVHDKDTTYAWTFSPGLSAPDAMPFTAFLEVLNFGTSDGGATRGCFAGHCDWRLPAIEELRAIRDATQGNCGGGSGPCIDQAVFGPTVADGYWSASSLADHGYAAWDVRFDSLGAGFNLKSASFWVRAVRSGL